MPLKWIQVGQCEFEFSKNWHDRAPGYIMNILYIINIKTAFTMKLWKWENLQNSSIQTKEDMTNPYKISKRVLKKGMQ